MANQTQKLKKQETKYTSKLLKLIEEFESRQGIDINFMNFGTGPRWEVSTKFKLNNNEVRKVLKGDNLEALLIALG